MVSLDPASAATRKYVLKIEEIVASPSYGVKTGRPMLQATQTNDGKAWSSMEIHDGWWNTGGTTIGQLYDAVGVLQKLQAGKWREAASCDPYSYSHAHIHGWVTMLDIPGSLTKGQDMKIKGKLGVNSVDFQCDYSLRGRTNYVVRSYGAAGDSPKKLLTEEEVARIEYYLVIKDRGTGCFDVDVPVVGNEAAIAHLATWMLSIAAAGRPTCILPPKRYLLLKQHTKVVVSKPGKGRAKAELGPYQAIAAEEMQSGEKWPRQYFPRVALSPACVAAFEAKHGPGAIEWEKLRYPRHDIRTDDRLLDLIVEMGFAACSIPGCEWTVACLPVEAVPGLVLDKYTGSPILASNHTESLEFSEEHLLMNLYRDMVKRRASEYVWWKTSLKWSYSDSIAKTEKAEELDTINDKFLYARTASVVYI